MATNPQDLNVSSETRKLLERWMRAINSEEDLQSRLTSAQCELTNSTNTLGKFLCPDDATDGEVFNIWYTDGLLQVTRKHIHDYDVSWRKKPHPKNLL